jgi:serine/threonine protein kinase
MDDPTQQHTSRSLHRSGPAPGSPSAAAGGPTVPVETTAGGAAEGADVTTPLSPPRQQPAEGAPAVSVAWTAADEATVAAAARTLAQPVPAATAPGQSPVAATAADVTTPVMPAGAASPPGITAGGMTQREDPFVTVKDRPGPARPASLPPGRPNPTHPYQANDEILPGYRLLVLLGRGGFGEVWKARGPGGTEVAIKVLANLDSNTGLKEYRSLQRIKLIRHAHIVLLQGVWLKDRQARILSEEAMEAFEQSLTKAPTVSLAATHGSLELITVMGLGDETLDARLKRAGPGGLPREQVLGWMLEAARGLDYLNDPRKRAAAGSQAIQHCDIKPQNILLVGDIAQICDLGLARFQDSHTQEIFASLPWAAPELLDGNAVATTDQYSLAVTTMQLISGRLPYPHGPNGQPIAAEIRKAKTTGEIDYSGWSAAEAKILRMATAIDPEKRFQSCEEFVKSLRLAGRGDRTERLVAGTTTKAIAASAAATVPLPETPRPAMLPGRRWLAAGHWLAAGPWAAGVTAALAVAVALWPSHPPSLLAEARKQHELYLAAEENRTAPGSAERGIAALRPLLKVFDQDPSLEVPSPDGNAGTFTSHDVIVTTAYLLGMKTDATAGELTYGLTLAQKALDTASDDTEKANAYETLGVVRAHAGDWDRAVEALREAVKLADRIGADADPYRAKLAAFEKRSFNWEGKADDWR